MEPKDYEFLFGSFAPHGEMKQGTYEDVVEYVNDQDLDGGTIVDAAENFWKGINDSGVEHIEIVLGHDEGAPAFAIRRVS